MKKILSILALALCFVACQNDGVENATNGGLVDVVLTVDAPELGVTRANDDDTQNGKNSAFGAIDFLSDADWANYDLRYILEVYAENETGKGTPIYSERLVNCLDKYAPTTFALRLVPNRSYKFVVFADFVAEGNAELTEPAEKRAIADLYYNTADLRNITAITAQPTWGAMNEIRDAYFVSENIKIENNGMTHGLTLTRPFAKLRVITTDLSYIAGYSTPGYVEVTYHDTDVFKSFNAVNGDLNTEKMADEELTYGYNVSKTIPYTEGYDAFATNQTLFTDYLFAVEGEQTTVKFTMAIYESEGGRMIHSHDFNTEIPIQRNHLTTIIGDLCTTQANITFDINDNFEDEFVIGWDDSYTNKIAINSWGEGQLTDNGDYAFTLSAEDKEFTVTVNGEAVENAVLAEGSYVLAEDAAEGNIYTFTVEGLQANATTRAMTAVDVIGGKMDVEKNEAGYSIELNLVVEFAAEEFVRYSSYTYEGALSINKPALATPEVTATVNDNVVTLSWDAVEGAAKYRVKVGNKTALIEGTSYEHIGEYGAEYTFSVCAIPANKDKYSDSEYRTVTAETVPVTALATPKVEWTAVDNKITLNWEAVEGAATYSVTVNGTTTPNIKKTSFEFTGNYETQYTFKVVAYPANEAKHTPSAAAEVTAKTADVTAIAAPVVTVAKDVKTITLTWEAVDGAAEYRVEVGGSTATIPATTYTFTGEYDKEYTFLVYAIPTDTAKHKTSAATEVTVKTDAIITLAKPNVTTTPSKNTIILSWTPVENAAYYTISGATEETVVVEGTEYTFEGEYNTPYTFYVVAVPANEVKYAASEAAVVEATTEAEPVTEYIYLKLNNRTWQSFSTIQVVVNGNSINMTEVEDNLYQVEKSKLTGTFYFYGSGRNSNDRTDDLTVQDGKNLYTITQYGWNGNAVGNWDTNN